MLLGVSWDWEVRSSGNWRNLYTVQVYMYRYSKYLHKRACFLKRFLKLFLIWCTVSLKFVLISELLTLTGLIITALIITKCQCNWTIENNIICCMDWLFVLYCGFQWSSTRLESLQNARRSSSRPLYERFTSTQNARILQTFQSGSSTHSWVCTSFF